eukprot:3559389-Pyramimonas_sp.AAC.1
MEKLSGQRELYCPTSTRGRCDSQRPTITWRSRAHCDGPRKRGKPPWLRGWTAECNRKKLR